MAWRTELAMDAIQDKASSRGESQGAPAGPAWQACGATGRILQIGTASEPPPFRQFAQGLRRCQRRAAD